MDAVEMLHTGHCCAVHLQGTLSSSSGDVMHWSY